MTMRLWYSHSMGIFRFFDHVADVGMEVTADSAADLFVTAGKGLMEWIGMPPSTTAACESLVDVSAEDLDSLLVGWLQELLYRFYCLHLYLIDATAFELNADLPKVKAILREKVWEESLSPNYREVKAVTYHNLKIEQVDGRWHVSVILDI
jgi:SHS2 domain-containing protein